ncbi:chromosome alignment-maintaining phosphoprotein 1-like [Mesocricetus auratus]|uniref:Chromosome alignment-maintaining phosphoprotein 1-like n=1 Tax=Mesocricetus auratus TaxID=10036 RepID=A0ABM2W858_MESAU|nr:chromosome alignment-maintaining phosphoprotein 1-like [Mesocricetus auratus]
MGKSPLRGSRGAGRLGEDGWVEGPGKIEERSQAEPNVQTSCGQTLRSPQEGTLGQEGPEPSDLASQGLPELHDPSKGLGAGLSHERAEGAEPQTLLTDSPQGSPEETPQGQRGQSPRGYTGESTRRPGKGAPQSQRERKQAQQEVKTPQCGDGGNSEVWGEAQGVAKVWRQEEGDPEGHSRDVCRSPGKPIPQHAETGIPGPPGSSAQLTPVVATQEGAWAPTPAAMPPWAPSPLRRPQEPQPRLQDALWEQRGPRDPKSWKAAWPEPRSREEAPAGAEQEALQRLLELHRAARERRLRDREQQRLRVLERLRILGNHRRRVHPLGLPPSAAQMAPQGDAAGWRRILRERLEQVHRGRTQWLRALGARNTQNFQELLSPGTEKPSPGE